MNLNRTSIHCGYFAASACVDGKIGRRKPSAQWSALTMASLSFQRTENGVGAARDKGCSNGGESATVCGHPSATALVTKKPNSPWIRGRARNFATRKTMLLHNSEPKAMARASLTGVFSWQLPIAKIKSAALNRPRGFAGTVRPPEETAILRHAKEGGYASD